LLTASKQDCNIAILIRMGNHILVLMEAVEIESKLSRLPDSKETI